MKRSGIEVSVRAIRFMQKTDFDKCIAYLNLIVLFNQKKNICSCDYALNMIQLIQNKCLAEARNYEKNFG